MIKKIPNTAVLTDKKAMAFREEYFAKLLKKNKAPKFCTQLAPVPLVRTEKWDLLDFLAEQRREVDIARRTVYRFADEMLAKSYSDAAGMMKYGGDPPPRIDAMCRSIVPLNGLIVLHGDYFVEGATEIFVQHADCYNHIPLDDSYAGDGGCWAMHPGHSVGWADARRTNEARFTLPDEERFLTHDSSYDTELTHIDLYSRLACMARVERAGDSNVYGGPHAIGFRSVPRSHFDDPSDVHSRPLPELEELLLEMVNEIRGWNGVGPLEMHSGLRDAARGHAQVMNEQWCFADFEGCVCRGWTDCSTEMHRAPGEPTLGERLASLGLRRWAENVSFSWGYNAPIKLAAESWDNSCEASGGGHRENQLGDFTHIGVGIERSEKTSRSGFTANYYTFTCDFGAW